MRDPYNDISRIQEYVEKKANIKYCKGYFKSHPEIDAKDLLESIIRNTFRNTVDCLMRKNPNMNRQDVVNEIRKKLS